MKAQIETITPSVAETYLKKNTMNRRLRKDLVYFLRDEIKDGRWTPNGATIVFSKDRLLDGQHRLHAIIAAQKAIRSLVVSDVPDEYFSTIDTGIPRKAADVLMIKGETKVTQLSSAIMWVMRYRMGDVMVRHKISPSAVENFLDANSQIRKSLELCDGLKLMSTSVAAAAHFLFRKKDETLADLFIDGLKNGFPKSEKDFFFDFRERMIENQTSVSKLHPSLQFALMVKAWNLMRGNEKPGTPLVFRPKGDREERFPEIR